MGFTSAANTAAYTAAAALDVKTPRFLRIAGDQKSAREIRTITKKVMGKKYRLIRAGGSGLSGLMITLVRFFSPALDTENVLPMYMTKLMPLHVVGEPLAYRLSLSITGK
jgi:hypothetical protein